MQSNNFLIIIICLLRLKHERVNLIFGFSFIYFNAYIEEILTKKIKLIYLIIYLMIDFLKLPLLLFRKIKYISSAQEF